MVIHAPEFAGDVVWVESIAINGACLTVITGCMNLSFEVSPETLRASIWANCSASPVNP